MVIDDQGLDALFRTARSRNAWAPETLPLSTWRNLYDVMKFGPTSANCSPARFVFVTTDAGKARLKPALSEGNLKALAAPCIVIIGHDLDFASHMLKLFPHNPGAKDWFAALAVRDATAMRNGTLQGGYLMLAARAMGLDCGPMSGFDPAKVDAEFFAGTQVKANFLCALGHGTDEPFPRSPRLDFNEACTIA